MVLIIAVDFVELCIFGFWEPVCGDSFTEKEGMVACQQLGKYSDGQYHSYSAAISATGNDFAVSLVYMIDGNANTDLESVNLAAYNVTLCSGNETKLTECLVDLPASPSCSEQAIIWCCK